MVLRGRGRTKRKLGGILSYLYLQYVGAVARWGGENQLLIAGSSGLAVHACLPFPALLNRLQRLSRARSDRSIPEIPPTHHPRQDAAPSSESTREPSGNCSLFILLLHLGSLVWEGR